MDLSEERLMRIERLRLTSWDTIPLLGVSVMGIIDAVEIVILSDRESGSRERPERGGRVNLCVPAER
jgi:hypothetical protein